MCFDSIEAAEQFYKDYGLAVGFSTRVGQQRKENDVVQWKRFMCSRQGYRKDWFYMMLATVQLKDL